MFTLLYTALMLLAMAKLLLIAYALILWQEYRRGDRLVRERALLRAARARLEGR